ncbi:MAG: glycosyltransferase family 2 protein [Gammaproteobacteria bacterium]|nr:glycosyltransferase family 2 protein [Gammaproteobacteria bacterium]
MKTKKNTYVLVSPARNEEAYIEKTIQSVIAQSVLPERWVIVSDGSTDRTDEIVKQYAADHSFIRLLRREPDISRNFSSKVYAVQAGVEQLSDIQYDFIGNLDADVSFEPDYYARILEKFRVQPELGIGGGLLYEICEGKWMPFYTSLEWSVSGAVQLFRRKCYEDIGGYLPMPKGGVDVIAEVMARMHAWKVRTFADIEVRHHRRMGTETQRVLAAYYRMGVMEYSHAYHPVFEWVRCIWRLKEKPYILGSIARISGYCHAFLRGDKWAVPDDVAKFLRQEQMQRLRALFKKLNSE